MATSLFDSTIFGPVKSRRLGVSLGINLLPNTSKFCNFDCIYCECGWTDNSRVQSNDLPSATTVRQLLDERLLNMHTNHEPLDVITFAGNGEPTMHPEFAQIIDDTIELRNKYFPKVKIAVLSNSTLIHNTKVFSALRKIDQNILKLDSAIEKTCIALNKPVSSFSIDNVIESLQSFEGHFILQTLFVKGSYNNISIDNTTDEELNAWIEVIKKVKPAQVMVYTIARDTPAQNLEKISMEKLQQIAQKVEQLGFKVQISH